MCFRGQRKMFPYLATSSDNCLLSFGEDEDEDEDDFVSNSGRSYTDSDSDVLDPTYTCSSDSDDSLDSNTEEMLLQFKRKTHIPLVKAPVKKAARSPATTSFLGSAKENYLQTEVRSSAKKECCEVETQNFISEIHSDLNNKTKARPPVPNCCKKEKSFKPSSDDELDDKETKHDKYKKPVRMCPFCK